MKGDGSPYIVRLQSFGLAFGEKTIMRDVTLEVPAHGCTVLMGPSGTGKSTLLRTIAGLTQNHPDARIHGLIQVGEQSGLPLKHPLPALVEQKARMLMASVRENLLSELPGRASIDRAEQSLLLQTKLTRWNQADLLQVLESQVIDLPLARQRAVAILRQAISNPPLLLVDEPTANLPPDQAASLVALLQAIKCDIPVLMISHHQGHARELADHVILLASGRVQESAPAPQFFANPQSEAGQQFVRTGSCSEATMVDASDGEYAEAEPEVASMPLPAPPTLPRPYAGLRGFVWLFDKQVAGTPWPGLVNDVEQDLDALRGHGITCLYSLTDRPFDENTAAQYGISCLCSPIPDMAAPGLTQTIALCQHIDRLVTQGQSVALHCKAGLGRTGTLLAAYWLWRQADNREARAAILHIRRLNSHMIQSAAQEEFIGVFAHHLTSMQQTGGKL